ncbi:MAG: glycosyl hydrolase, partial [Flavobacteriaceae bacterium]
TTAAVHDLAIQTKENHLLVGTHGRSIYKADISTLQEEVSDLTLLPVEDIRHSKRWGESYSSWRKPSLPAVEFRVFSKNSALVKWAIYDDKKTLVYESEQSLDRGYNFINYDITIGKEQLKNYQRKNKNNPLKSAKNGQFYLPKGTYTFKVEQAGHSKSQSFKIK